MPTIRFGDTTCEASNTAECIVFGDLRGGGSPRDLLALIRWIRAVAKVKKVYLSVDMHNPRREQLMTVYKHFGAREACILLEVE